MVDIRASLVKTLRDKTGAGMMDCKKALQETAGDLEAAVDWLRTKGLAAAAEKAGRIAAEGLVGVVVRDQAGAIVEVNTETDFVARNEGFQEFVSTVAGIALEVEGRMEAIKSTVYPDGGRTVDEQLTEMIASSGENMSLRRARYVKADAGLLGAYVHAALAPGLGRIGVLVGIRSDGDVSALEPLAKQLAMHVAAARPQSISPDDLAENVLERERKVLLEQARQSRKPETIVEKMVEGRLRKFYEEVCLLEQTFVIDGQKRVRAVLEAAGRDHGTSVTVTDFARFALGEGIERETGNFAADVAAAVRA